jgi:class 3 adenylate cyclase
VGLFGAPVAHEDHARRAVLAAIELRQRLQEAAACSVQPRDKRVRLRMGLHTGSLVVGPLPSTPQQLYTALGRPPRWPPSCGSGRTLRPCS